MTGYILALAVILRLVLINQSLWLDEAIEALALKGEMGPILTYALADFQPPLYHLIGIVWTGVAGFSEIALRTPSLLAGIGLVYFSVKLGSRLGGSKAGLYAGLLTATNPLLIYYSQEGRTYEMTAFFITASYYYLHVLLGRESRRDHVMYGLMTLAALWTSYIAWIAVGLQALYLLWQKKYKILSSTVLAFTTLILWLPSLLSSLGIGLATVRTSPEWGKVVGGVTAKSIALTWVKMAIGRIGFENTAVYGGVILTIAALHGYALSRIRKVHPLLIVWLLAMPAAILVSLIVPVYSYFRVLFLVPAYLIVLAIALARLPRGWLFAVVGSQLICWGIFVITPRFHREDWRSVTEYINARDGVAALPSKAQIAPLKYYGIARPVQEPKEGLDREYAAIYYIKYVEDVFDPGKKGPAAIESAGYQITGSHTYPGLQMDIYERIRERE